ncbi:MAG: substrate-binding domain-containing protein, partial [Oscillospiraceae bacterium]|nr:substrate-binding domain-containing protein [Oscillospiraceae bacterium]
GNIQLTIYKKHSKVIADTPFFQALIEGIESKSRHNGYNLIINYMSNNLLDIEGLKASLKENEISGMLILATEMDEEDMLCFLSLDIPIVVLDAYFLGINADYVVINNVSGGYLGTRHLIECDHKKIGYLMSSYPIKNFNERYEGYLKALNERDLKANPDFIIKLAPSMEGAYEDMIKYLKDAHELPTALFADNDLIAFGAIKAFKEMGINIPKDISIVGFDDMPFCTIIDPPLSTINVNKKTFGKIAVEKLLSSMNEKLEYTSKTTLDVTLIKRNSVRNLKEV